MSRPIPLAKLLSTLMQDGQPHYEFELELEMMKHIPPEIAVREARGKNGNPLLLEDSAFEYAVHLGIRSKVRASLKQMEKKKRAEVITMPNGKRAWTLLPDAPRRSVKRWALDATEKQQFHEAFIKMKKAKADTKGQST